MNREKPTEEGAVEYRAAMDQLIMLARSIEAVPLDWLLATISRAEAIGPVLHPTAYRDSDLAAQRDLVEAGIDFRTASISVSNRLKEQP